MYFSHLKSIVIATFLAFSFVACGGDAGSGSSSTPKTDTNASQNITTTMQDIKAGVATYKDLFSMPDTHPDKTALILDAYGVQGLKVTCGNKETHTEQNGLFECNTLPLSIYLGDFKLGEFSAIPKDKLIYTQDILHLPRAATVHPDVTKLSMILQSLDEDADISNGITITQASLDILNSDLANFTNITQLTMEDVTNIISDVIKTRKAENPETKLTKVTIKQAQDNLTQALASAPATKMDTMVFTSINK